MAGLVIFMESIDCAVVLKLMAKKATRYKKRFICKIFLIIYFLNGKAEYKKKYSRNQIKMKGLGFYQ